MYTIYICNLATNSSCCYYFLDMAQKLNPDLKFIDEIRSQYQTMARMWNNQDVKDIEAIGGFNITLGALQDRERRGRIVAKIRAFAECTDKIIAAACKNT